MRLWIVAAALVPLLALAEENHQEELSSNRVDELREETSLNWENADGSVDEVMSVLEGSLRGRLENMFKKTTSKQCRMKIAEHFGYFVASLGTENPLPFTDVTFPNQCGEKVYQWDDLPEDVHIADIQNRTYQPPRNESTYKSADELKLLYAILTHDNALSTIRLMEALYEKRLHSFVIHVDGKYDDTQRILLEYAKDKDYIHILEDPYRVRVNWGGFSMVNATLQTMRFAFGLHESSNRVLDFDKLVHLSSSSYPLASNPEIRHKLASFPLDANFLHIVMQPTRPRLTSWHYFVECDDSLHRIYELPPLRREIHGADMYTSSQWFIISRDFAWYLAEAAPGSFVDQYLRYAEHIVVSDETFFGVVLRHTAFCHKHHNSNFLHLQFDRWESELPAEHRDERKCPMPDPDHCGRSPTLMTLDYADIMELSADLFARKFDDSVDSTVKDVVDQWRESRAYAIETKGVHPDSAFQMKNIDFEGHGVLIVARDTVNSSIPLCLAIGETGNKMQLLPCFASWAPATLAEGWEEGAVVLHETIPHTRWQVGPCTTDGQVERLKTGKLNVTLGKYSLTGPRCMLQQMDGMRAQRCFDGGSTTFQPGGETQVYPCVREWFQFVSFGDGRIAPPGSLYSTIPSHVVKQIKKMGHSQSPHLCLGVYDRGVEDELDWDSDEYNEKKKEPDSRRADPTSHEELKWELLSEWNEASIVTTQCTNLGAVIEWAFVPFIEEDLVKGDDEPLTSKTIDDNCSNGEGYCGEL